jgi:hypothetical protein
VAPNETAHPVSVLPDQAFVDLPVIFKVETDPFHIQKVDPAFDDQFFPNVLKNLAQGHILASFIQQLVKSETLDGIAGQVSLGQQAVAPVEIGSELRQVLVRPILQRQECSRDLQQLLDGINLHDFFHTEFLYEDSLMGNFFEESIVLETDDRFPDGRTTAIQLLADDILADFLPRFQIKLQNGPLEPIINLPEIALPKIIQAMYRSDRCLFQLTCLLMH